MANLYGVANPVIQPQLTSTIGGVNINCPAGVETPIATSAPLAAISSGVYYPSILGGVSLNVGPAALTSFAMSARVSSGSDFVVVNFPASLFPAVAWICLPVVFYGPGSVVPWQGGGSTITLTVTPVGSNVVAYAGGTELYVSLYRAPDQ